MKILMNVALVAGLLLTAVAYAEDQAPAQTAGEKYSSFDVGLLKDAKLEKMEPNTIAKMDGTVITKDELDERIKEAPEKYKKVVERLKPLLLAQLLQRQLLLDQAKKEGLVEGDTAEAENEAIKKLIDKQMGNVQVTDAEVEAFYEKHKEEFPGVEADKMKDRIRQYLLQQKKMEKMQAYMQDLSKNVQVSVNEDWAAEQDKIMQDNPVGKARQSGKAAMVEFSADWCPTCQKMKPTVDELKKEVGDKYTIVTVDVEQDETLPVQYGVQALPTIIFYSPTGKEVNRVEGEMTKEEMLDNLQKAQQGISQQEEKQNEAPAEAENKPEAQEQAQ